jgi:hypothetical protein
VKSFGSGRLPCFITITLDGKERPLCGEMALRPAAAMRDRPHPGHVDHDLVRKTRTCGRPGHRPTGGGPRVGPRAGWRTSRGESIAWPSPWFPGPMGGAASSERSRWLAVTRRAAGRRRHLPTGRRAGSLWAGRSPPAPSRAARAATATSARAASRSAPSPGRHCYSTLSLAVIDCHSLGIYNTQ